MGFFSPSLSPSPTGSWRVSDDDLSAMWGDTVNVDERNTVLDDVYPEWRAASRKQLLEWLAAETHDVMMITEQVAIAYCNLTGGRISKPNTLAHHVIAAAEEHMYSIDDEVQQSCDAINAANHPGNPL